MSSKKTMTNLSKYGRTTDSWLLGMLKERWTTQKASQEIQNGLHVCGRLFCIYQDGASVFDGNHPEI